MWDSVRTDRRESDLEPDTGLISARERVGTLGAGRRWHTAPVACVEYRLLGPVEVRHRQRPLPLAGPKVRTLLAALLVGVNRVVPLDSLVDDMWGDNPPSSAKNLVQGYVSDLRAVLVSAGVGQALVTQPPGYVLKVTRGRLDVHRFEALLTRAEHAMAEGRDEVAAEWLREGLALWRGPALSGVTSESLLRTAGARLDERRLIALERRIEADLRLGRHEELVAELADHVAAHPFRERMTGQLMLALHRSGRTAEALLAYERARRTLARELGVEPAPAVAELAQSIWRGDPDLRHTSRLPSPMQLPRATEDFTGRQAEMAAIRGLLAPSTQEGVPAVTTVLMITGPAGIGKTTLAVQAAHRLRSSFPGGQLFADLQGAEDRALDPGEVLAGFLRALGVDGAAIPAELNERAGLYRTRLAERRALVVLDNAASEAQVRPLLPSGAGCAVLVTSRAPLGGLRVARTLSLPVLEADEAINLLAAVAGPTRVTSELGSARAIVELCGRLPLAVRIAGARLATRPDRTLHGFAARLTDERRRLDELRVGDLDVRASLALSYRGLDEAGRRAFRHLGLLEAPDFAAWLVAGLLDLTVTDAEELLERLVDSRLLEAAGDDCAGQPRYRLHNLLRLFARELVREHEHPESQRTELQRVLAAQLGLSELAHRTLSRGNADQVPSGTAPRWLPAERDVIAAVQADPLAWFEAERATLRSGVEQACRAELSEFAWELACSAATFFGMRGYWQDWHTTHERAIEACRRAGNSRGEIHATQILGVSCLWLGELPRAQVCFERCLRMAGELGEEDGQRAALLGLGLVSVYRGETDQATSRLDRSRRGFAQAQNRHGEAIALVGLGEVHRFERRLSDAADALAAALAIFRETGDRHWEAIALLALADLQRAADRPNAAEASLERCLEIFRRFGNRHFAALVLYRLARLMRDQDRAEGAIACLDQCVLAFRELALSLWEARALNSLGKALAAVSRFADAADAWRAALTVFRDLGAVDAAAVEAQLSALGRRAPRDP